MKLVPGGQIRIRTKSKYGFSLMEVIVSIAILSIVSTIGVSMFIKVTDAWRIANARAELYRTGDRVLEQIRDDISRMVSSDMSGVSVNGLSRYYVEESSDSPLWRVRREDDKMLLPVEVPVDGTGNTRRFLVHYEIDHQTAPSALVRNTTPFGVYVSDNDGSILLESVLSLRIEYLEQNASPDDQSAWVTQWDATYNPRAIRVSLVMSNPLRLDQQISRQATYYTAVR